MTVGFHGQNPINNWLDAIKELPAGAPVLAVDNVHMLRDAKIVNSGVLTIFRKKINEQAFTPNFEEAKQKARDYFNTFIDGTWQQQELWRYVDVVKEWNEYVASSQNEAERQLIITWLKAVTQVWNNEYRNTAKVGYRDIPLACLSVAIGNDIDPRYAKIIADSGNIISYHNYTHFENGQRDPEDWRYHSGRWAYMDAQFLAQGIKCRWISTEGGIYEGVYDGWKSAKTVNGSLQRYIDECIKYQLDNVAAWNKANGNRYLGSVLFTFGNTGSWPMYELNTGEMVEIAKVVKSYAPQNPTEPPIDPPPIDPPTEPGDGLPRVQYKRNYWTVPQNVTESQWLEICRQAFTEKRTVGFSYDDAGIGALNEKTAVLYGITNQAEFIAWFNENYPGTKLEFRELPKL